MIFGKIFARPEEIRIAVVCSRTGRRRDITVRVAGEFLDLQPPWWGEVLNMIACSEGCWCI